MSKKDRVEARRLLDVMECLIDTVRSTTDLENIYDDSRSKSVSWETVWTEYGLLKERAGIE